MNPTPAPAQPGSAAPSSTGAAAPVTAAPADTPAPVHLHTREVPA